MAEESKEQEVKVDQFKRNFAHLLIEKDGGPELDFGGDIGVLRFKKKAPVKALAALIANDNQVEAMETYLKKCLVKGQDEKLAALLEEVDVNGLGEILGFLSESYSSFPEKS